MGICFENQASSICVKRLMKFFIYLHCLSVDKWHWLWTLVMQLRLRHCSAASWHRRVSGSNSPLKVKNQVMTTTQLKSSTLSLLMIVFLNNVSSGVLKVHQRTCWNAQFDFLHKFTWHRWQIFILIHMDTLTRPFQWKNKLMDTNCDVRRETNK